MLTVCVNILCETSHKDDVTDDFIHGKLADIRYDSNFFLDLSKENTYHLF